MWKRRRARGQSVQTEVLVERKKGDGLVCACQRFSTSNVTRRLHFETVALLDVACVRCVAATVPSASLAVDAVSATH